ncbi:hypothetical protein HY524_00385 [Candidatus Berkelbacteria bacterium]|nr:hypothetical protein [Candidatus Berkelbacteria bacterium]
MKCKHQLSNNNQCGAWAMKSSEFCFTHNPVTSDDRRAAVVKGGSATYERGLIPLEPVDLTDSKLILWLMIDTINRVRKVKPDGAMDVRTANCIGQLTRVLLEAQKELDVTERLARLEAKAGIQ